MTHGYANEGAGPASQALVDHVTADVVTCAAVARNDGHVTVPEQSGLGVELDEAAMARYATLSSENC